MNSCLHNEENARAVEHAIRTAVNTVMDVIYNMNSTKILEYERKVAERDKENETLKYKLKKAEDELTTFRVGLSFELSALSPERDFGKPMCNENEVASENDWRMDFPSLNAGTPGLSAERARGQSPSAIPVTSPVIKEEPADTGSFYIKWEMSEESIAEQQEGLGPMHVFGKESDGTSSVAGSQSPGDRRSEQSEETLTEHVKRRLSSAETQRQYRERIRADPEKLRAYKERAKCREEEEDDDEDWISNFHVPWQQTPESLRRAIAEGQRVEAADRRLMVRITVDAMRVHCLNPNKKVCAEIAKAIVAEYPESFADLSKEGELLSRRYSSLLTQIKTRVEHVNRNTENRIRRPKTCKKGEHSNRQAKTARTKVDSYGCINWHPQDLPEGETPESLENKRQIMATIFNSAGPRGVDRGDVDELMRLTYINQRHMINAWPAPSIGDVKEQWPFLFTKRWLCAHFHMLTGVEINSCLSGALLSKGKTIVNFFRSQKPNWRRGIQSLLNDIEGDLSGNNKDLTACAAILLVLSHFREKEDSLFLLADVNDTQMDVEAQLHLPATPRLIMLGSSLLASSKWMVSLEGRVVCVLENQSDFAAALSVLFGCFYVFNTEYQEAASATLELIQRFLVGINPNEGTKCSSYLDSEAGVSRRTGRVVQRKTDAVATFLKDLTEFEW